MLSTNKELFQKLLAPTCDYPLGLEISRAEGIYVYDNNGKPYMDMIAGIGVSSIGHGHPKLLNALHTQIDKFLHVMVYGECIQQPQITLAQKLNDILPENLNCTYLVNSGTEANEGALKLARRVTGRSQLISCKKAYHGSSMGSLSVSGNEIKKYAFRPLLPDVKFIEFNNEDDFDHITEKTAAVIIEPIQGDAGVRIPSKDYLKNLKKKCESVGALLIFDEIQTGFGRTGTMFAFEQFDVVPDILTIAKGMGGGVPIGAFVSSFENMQLLKTDPALGHITTFGGHPLPAVAASTTIDVIQNELLADVNSKGLLLKNSIQHHKVKEIRQIGLMLAVELDTAEEVIQVVEKCLENGLIGFYFLSTRNAFRLAPPLIISIEEIKKASKIILAAFDLLK